MESNNKAVKALGYIITSSILNVLSFALSDWQATLKIAIKKLKNRCLLYLIFEAVNCNRMFIILILYNLMLQICVPFITLALISVNKC